MVVLALVGMAVLVIGTGLLPWPSDRPTTGSRNAYANGALTPEENTMVVTPQPNGTAMVTQTLVFDAGRGSTGTVDWAVGGVRVGWESDQRSAQFGVVPTISDVQAEEVGADGDRTPLSTALDDANYRDPFLDRRWYKMSAPNGWAEGRHAVKITYRLAGTFVRLDGQAVLVVPLDFAAGPETTASHLESADCRSPAAPPFAVWRTISAPGHSAPAPTEPAAT